MYREWLILVVVLKKKDALRKHMAEGNDSETAGPSSTAPSLLAKLRCPQPAEISRKRKVATTELHPTRLAVLYNPGKKQHETASGCFQGCKASEPTKGCRNASFCFRCRWSIFFSFTTSAMLSDRKAELPSYVAKADGIDPNFCRLRWWKSNSTTLPHWSALARQVLLVQPSSAAAERVFSLLANSFGDQQTSALQDYIETSIMLQYNKHWTQSVTLIFSIELTS